MPAAATRVEPLASSTACRRLARAAGLGVLAGLAAPAAAQCELAGYEVTFTAEWSQATHPDMFPGNPHFSPLIGATHSDAVSFWAPGVLASNGIEVMAETGGITPLRDEVLAAIAAQTADAVVQGGGVAVSPGERTLFFDVDPDYPLVTLVTMIAPSPDWFVGVHGLSLRDDAGWRDLVEVDLWAYDAGTDSGATYTSPNADTSPAEPIRALTDEPPFAGAGRIGTMTFRLVQVAGCSAADLAPPCGVHDFFDVARYLELYNTGDPAADFAAPLGTLNFFDIAAFLTAFTDGCP